MKLNLRISNKGNFSQRLLAICTAKISNVQLSFLQIIYNLTKNMSHVLNVEFKIVPCVNRKLIEVKNVSLKKLMRKWSGLLITITGNYALGARELLSQLTDAIISLVIVIMNFVISVVQNGKNALVIIGMKKDLLLLLMKESKIMKL